MVRSRMLALVAAFSAVVGACASEPPATQSREPTPSGSLSSVPTSRPATTVATGQLVRSTAARGDADVEAGKRAAKALEALSSDLYGQLAKERGNIVFSPYSVAYALAMTRVGARGRTADEIGAVLHTPIAGDLDAGFNALDRALAKRSGKYPYGGTTVELELATANRLWGQRGYEFVNAFLDRLAASYGADVGVVDYATARAEARKAINEWVSDRTHARIPDILPDGVLDELTRFVLTNALYLKAKWVSPFIKGATAPAPFHRLDGTDVRANMMRARISMFDYGRGSGYEAVSLPYVGGLSMIVIVPNPGSFASFEVSLADGKRLGQIAGGLAKTTYVNLSLPRFEFRTPTSLNEPLSRLGMPLAFKPETADFSGITTRERLYIQAVLHQAFISVDEEGTEAAAATAVGFGATGGPSQWIDLVVDRPFVFLIRDDETGAILFMGRVVDPS